MVNASSSGITWAPPEIPHKHDIIPIHNSDRASFKRCRRYWNWSSPARSNLTLRADTHGINTNLWFGTGIHWALEQYYNPGLRHDPVEAWKTWFDIQWRGGIVTADWLDRVYDLRPKPTGSYIGEAEGSLSLGTFKPGEGYSALYEVRGLEDILPDPDTSEFDELYELGIGMMTFYKSYAERVDDFEIIVPEHDFSVPIWDYANDCILTAVDTREQSPNFGKELEVHARGRMDAIGIRISNERFLILENKTAQSIGEDYFRKLETDEQCTSYLWAAEVESQYYDLPNKGVPIEEIIYNTLRKATPREPTMLKNGMFSTNRVEESCTYEMLQTWIARNMPGVPLNPKQAEYLAWLRDVGDEQFIIRKLVRRNRHQLHNAGLRIYLEALDMLDPNLRIYPNIRNDYPCLNCQFRPPCLAVEDGSDFMQLLNDNYTVNKDR